MVNVKMSYDSEVNDIIYDYNILNVSVEKDLLVYLLSSDSLNSSNILKFEENEWFEYNVGINYSKKLSSSEIGIIREFYIREGRDSCLKFLEKGFEVSEKLCCNKLLDMLIEHMGWDK